MAAADFATQTHTSCSIAARPRSDAPPIALTAFCRPFKHGRLNDIICTLEDRSQEKSKLIIQSMKRFRFTTCFYCCSQLIAYKFEREKRKIYTTGTHSRMQRPAKRRAKHKVGAEYASSLEYDNDTTQHCHPFPRSSS